MFEFTASIRITGKSTVQSLGLTIPYELVKRYNLRVGQIIRIRVVKLAPYHRKSKTEVEKQ
jgi:hypothetical protein